MRKTLLSASLFLAGMAASYAQVPDASAWSVGDDITSQVMGNPSFNDAPLEPWKAESAAGAVNTPGGLVEVYDGIGVDLYQYVELPAGMYKVECQGYYRNGTSWADDPSTFGTEDWQDNALLYVSNGVYDIESETFTAGRTFKTPLMPRLFEQYGTKLYTDELQPDGWDMSDGEYPAGSGVYGPCSIPGSEIWFANGLFSPYNEGGVTYNSTTFFLTQDGTARIGVQKTVQRSADCFMVTNFHLYYLGEAGEAAEIAALTDEVEEMRLKLEEIADLNPGLLGTYIWENISYNPTADKEALEAEWVKLSEFLEEMQAAVADVQTLQTAIASMTMLAEQTDFAGKAKFEEALAAAEEMISDSYDFEDGDTPALLKGAIEALYAGRTEYLLSDGPSADGSYDFSTFIANRFFTTEENNPTWNPENNKWEYSREIQEKYAGLFLNAEGNWAPTMETGFGDEGAGAALRQMSGSVKVGVDDSEPFKWYRTSQNGPGGEVYFNHDLTSFKAWAITPTAGFTTIGQLLTGMPNGYYSLTGLGATWLNDDVAAGDMHFEISSGENSSRSEKCPGEGWWGPGYNQWKTLSTGMIQVTDGTVRVEFKANGFYSVTGFQLKYYGETPNFDALIAADKAATAESIENLAWVGDKAVAGAIFAEFPATITSDDEYKAAVEILDRANDYVKKANNAISNWRGFENMVALGGQYPESYAILAPAYTYTMALGEGVDDTYEKANENGAQVDAYVAYMKYRSENAESLTSESSVAIIAAQEAYLAENFASVEVMDGYMKDLASQNMEKIFEQYADASELNPADVTFLLANPSFVDSPNEGWTCTNTETGGAIWPSINEFGYENAEIWNVGPFVLKQRIIGLPAGAYELRVKALYRDGDGVSNDRVEAYNNAGSPEAWEKNNLKLFVEIVGGVEKHVAVTGIEALQATETSFKEVVTGWDYEEGVGKFPTAIKATSDMQGNETYLETYPDISYVYDLVEGNYPMDLKLTFGSGDEAVTYYYPSSMQGAYQTMKKYDAYNNAIQFYLEKSESVDLGLRKDAAIPSDWAIYDDFQLFYLGKGVPTDIDKTEDVKGEGKMLYTSPAGIESTTPFSGINVVKFENGATEKVNF